MFKTKLKAKRIKDGIYELKEPLEYEYGNILFVVPVGFRTDLASVPKGLQWLYKPNGKYSRSAVLHDFLYSRTKLIRKQCDVIFKDAMKDDEVNEFTIDQFYLSVRLFGFLYRSKK